MRRGGTKMREPQRVWETRRWSDKEVVVVMVVVVVVVLVGCLLPSPAHAQTEGLEGRIKVISLQESFIPDTSSSARWLGGVPRTVMEVTLCYRLRIFYYRPEVTVFSYFSTTGHEIRTDHNRVGVQVLASAAGRRLSTNLVTPLLQWSAFCVSLTAGEPIIMYFNGERVEGTQAGYGDVNGTSAAGVLMEPEGTIVLGQDQDVSGDVFDATQSLCGAVTDLNVWSRRLSGDEMANVTRCLTRDKGDVLSWEDAEFEIGNDSSVVEARLKETCMVVPVPFFMFPNHMEFTKAAGLCKAFGGSLVAPKNEEEQEAAYSLAEESTEQCSKEGQPLTWVGITKDENDIWIYHATDKNVTFFNWAPGQPNNVDGEQCTVMKGRLLKGRWADQSCRKSYKVCVLCTLKLPVFLRFRGICDSTLYDDRFVMAGTRNDKPYFRGYYRSHIYYTEEQRWRLQSIMESGKFAEMDNDGSVDFPIGRHEWNFSHGFCGHETNEEHSLTLSQCARNEEFTCDDGTCIVINEVCDRRVQCPDGSDELDCSTVTLPKGYQSTLPPPSLILDAPLPVYVNITLRSFIEINAIESKFRAELLVLMLWKDQRLRFQHLRSDRQLNIILSSEAKNIWVPTIDFLNAENNLQTVVDEASKITITRLGQPRDDDIQNSKEARIYEGRDNYIRNSRKYAIVFLCNFNFFYYPFNTDYCSMIFRVNKNTETYITLEKYGAGTIYTGRDTLPEYVIGGMKTRRYKTIEPYSGLETVIQMRHLYTTQVVTVFIPTTLISIISFATLSFKWFDFQNRVMVSLTALLVLTTLFSQVSDSLPKTSYFKLIDVWFFISILFGFLTIMTHTLVEYHHHYKDNEEQKSSFLNFAPIKVVPAHVNDEEIKRRVKEEKFKNRWGKSMPEFVNKVAYTLILSAYAIFFIVFWCLAFSQKIKEDAKNFAREYDDMDGYPA